MKQKLISERERGRVRELVEGEGREDREGRGELRERREREGRRRTLCSSRFVSAEAGGGIGARETVWLQ